MAAPKVRHPAHPLQPVLLGACRRLDPDVSLASKGAALGAAGLPCSEPHVSRLMTGETGASARELFVLLEHYGLKVATRALARLSGLTVVEIPEPEAGGSLAEAALSVGVVTGQLQATVREALADGRIDTRELAEIGHALDVWIEQAMQMRASLHPTPAPVDDEAARRQTRSGRAA